jgi:hypothetical protein
MCNAKDMGNMRRTDLMAVIVEQGQSWQESSADGSASYAPGVQSSQFTPVVLSLQF